MVKLRTKRSKRGDESQESAVETPSKKTRTTKTGGDGGGGGESEKQVDQAELIRALLSDKAYAVAYPPIGKGHGEVDMSPSQRRKPLPNTNAGRGAAVKKQVDIDDVDSASCDISTGKPRGYSSSSLSPYEELLSAVLLSKPLSHRLGLRAIATLLSPPYSFRTIDALARAGVEGRRAALYEARTQHKDKTAAQLGDMAASVQALCGHDHENQNALRHVQQLVEKSDTQQAALDVVQRQLVDNVKGLGQTGVAIFLRRIQAHDGWQRIYPYIDHRTVATARKLGLLSSSNAAGDDTAHAAKELVEMLDKDGDEQRHDFVRLLDVLVGLGFHSDLRAAKRTLVSQLC